MNLMINTFMRFDEFKKPKLYPYTVIVVLSDHASAKTLVYADSPENAWLVACRQYGSENIVSVNDPRVKDQNKPVDKPSSIQFWADRFRKFSQLAKAPPQPKTFSQKAKEYLEQGQMRLLAKTKAEKAGRELSKLKR